MVSTFNQFDYGDVSEFTILLNFRCLASNARKKVFSILKINVVSTLQTEFSCSTIQAPKGADDETASPDTQKVDRLLPSAQR